MQLCHAAAAVVLFLSLFLLPSTSNAQISNILPLSEADAPAPEPEAKPNQVDLTDLMSAHGCKVFAETLSANPAQQTFEGNVKSGLTIFCPGDDAMKSFMPKYKNLSADGKQSLLEYHGTPIYQTVSDLRSGNGLTTTLATDGNTYSFTVQNDGNDLTIKTKIVTARIVHTLTEKSPLAIHQLDKVLMPVELFKSSLPPAPAPAPAHEADAESPKPSKKHKSLPAPAAPADSPDGDVADQSANGNGAVRFNGGGFGAVILSLWLLFLQP